jgi:hypothetical protein
MQQEAMKQACISRLEEFDKEIQEMEMLIGDAATAEDDSGGDGIKYEEIPPPIQEAALKDDVQKVLGWLGPPPVPPERINARTSDADACGSLLHFVRSPGLATKLLMLGADVDPKNAFGFTPLFGSCYFPQDYEVSQVLIQWGADKETTMANPDPTNNEGSESALEAAASNGNAKLACLLQSPLGGRRCEMVGLKQRSDLNGLTCIVGKYLGEAVDRYEAQVETTKEAVRIRSANLKRRDRTPSNPGITLHYTGRDSKTGFTVYDFVVVDPPDPKRANTGLAGETMTAKAAT